MRHGRAAVEVVGLPDVPQVGIPGRVGEAEALHLEAVDEAVDDERRVVGGEAGPAPAEGGAELLVEVQGLEALVVVVEDGHLAAASLELGEQVADPGERLGGVGEGRRGGTDRGRQSSGGQSRLSEGSVIVSTPAPGCRAAVARRSGRAGAVP